MTAPPPDSPRLLVVGGCGGLVGRAVLGEFGRDHRIRSVHRHPIPSDSAPGVEFVAGDLARIDRWEPLLDGVDTILNLAWYRQGSARRFAPLRDGIVRLIDAARSVGTRRFVHLSVPDAPPDLERDLPYLRYRREVDRTLGASSLDFVIVRPTMLFGPGDKLATVMLRTIHRYGRLPLFGDGEYHLSPLSTRDLARVLRREGMIGGRRTVTVGGPRRWKYPELTDRMFAAFHRPPRYLRLSRANSLRLASVLELFGSSLLYRYEVEWLLSDMLGAPAYQGHDTPLDSIEPFLDREAERYGARGRS
ncbi:MAG TPA: NAD(P)H-binding protein [Thermoplasmata archaeon]|nr:NAD(P)H-binding protein [Thermoplasmata archaeon]